MHKIKLYGLTVFACCVLVLATAAAEDNALPCPLRPNPGSVVQDALTLSSQNGVLNAALVMRHSIDHNGFNHFCYDYQTANGEIESPTLQLTQGDHLHLNVTDRIQDSGGDELGMSHSMEMPANTCGDSGPVTIRSTNVHFHGLNVAPTCHSDNVLTTLIEPNSPGFDYDIHIPKNEPPGLYWYHPHIHGFADYQVNGGAAGALVVQGMENFRPEVAGLKQRVFVIRQQFLKPWVPGPYQLTINYQTADYPNTPAPVIKMAPGKKEFWRVANSTTQGFLVLQVLVNNKPQRFQMIAFDGYPLSAPRYQDSVTLPPAGRAEFIVDAPPAGSSAIFQTAQYNDGPTGNPNLQTQLAGIELTKDGEDDPGVYMPTPARAPSRAARKLLRFSGLATAKVTAQRKLYFSEQFNGSNGPSQFYITVDGERPKVFEPEEKPTIVTKVGAVEDWTIENRALESHAFHIHQIHFLLLEVDGKPVEHPDMRDTMEIPFYSGSGPYHSIKVRMDFRDPEIAGTFVYHCHILDHEDQGMMHKIRVDPK
ncbi:MAG TPA: multicopper oxidase domain-containing protein [Terriglobales bacterium]